MILNQTSEKAAIYIRVSSDEQATKGFSLENQQDRLIENAIKDGFIDYEVFTDEGISGRSTDKRAAFNLMMDRIEAQEFSCVYIYALSRFARSTIDGVLSIKKIQENSCELVSYTERLDTRTPMGMFFVRTMFSLAELESDQISDRVKSVFANKKRKGERYSRPIFGFKQDNNKLEVVESEAFVIQRVFNILKHNPKQSLRKIADVLNERGCRTKYGKRFNHMAVKRIIEKKELYEQHGII